MDQVSAPMCLTTPTLISEQNWPDGTPPLVSIVSFTYNHENYISECIEGFLMQETTFPVEIIIHDDASTDCTASILQQYADRYPKLIRLVLQAENQMSKGIGIVTTVVGQARGGYIAVCDGDDYWTDKRKLMLQMEFLDKNANVDIAFHSCMLREKDKAELQGPFRVQSAHNTVIDVGKVIAGDGGYMPTPSIFFRKHVIEAIPSSIFNNSFAGDFLIQIYGSLRGGAGYINRPMCVYRVGHAASWTSSLKEQDKLIRFQNNFFEMVNEVEHDLNDYGDAFNELILKHYSAQAYEAYLTGNRLCLDVCLEILQQRKKQFSLKQKIFVSLIRLKFCRIIFYTFRSIIHFLIKIRQIITGR